MRAREVMRPVKKRVVLGTSCVLALTLVGLWSPRDARGVPAATSTAEDQVETLVVDGRTRRALIHLPPKGVSQRLLPAVLVLHGHGSDAEHVRRISGMDAAADREGFLAVYPDGSGWRNMHLSWNAGACCGYAVSAQVDGVGFIRALIDYLMRTYPVDSKRVYVTGISNGGMMAHRVGCELADRIAAIAPVAGALNAPACTPAHPVSVILFHGTADAYVPYAGGRGRAGRDERRDPPVAAAVSFWVAHNRCAAAPQTAADGSIIREAYTGCADDAEVVLYTIRDGAHAWPGGRRGWRFGTAPTQEISATDRMWEFFSRHPKP